MEADSLAPLAVVSSEEVEESSAEWSMLYSELESMLCSVPAVPSDKLSTELWASCSRWVEVGSEEGNEGSLMISVGIKPVRAPPKA